MVVPFVVQALEVDNVHRGVLRRSTLIRAVGETAPDADVDERLHIGACVIRAADVVRPGVHRRNTRIDHLGAT